MGHRVILKLSVLAAGIAMLSAASASAMDVNIDGFGSAYYAETFQKGLLPTNFSQGTAPDFTHFSLIGLNVNSKINEQWSAAAQLVGKGSTVGSIGNNFNISAEYAYVQYKPMADWTVRAGRQRLPFFTASEYINEHYLLPMREIPAIVYNLAPFATFDGVSVGKAFDVGMGKVNVAVFGGNPLLDKSLTGVTITGQNLYGARVNWEGEGWRVRMQASQMEEYANYSASGLTSTVTSAGTYTGRQTFLSAGYRWDKMNIVSWGEYVYRHADNGTPNPHNGDSSFNKADGGYVLLGYRLGDWMPRYTFAHGESVIALQPAANMASHTVGVNYSVSPKVVLKAEYEHTSIANNNGTDANAGLVAGMTVQSGATPATSADSAYVGVDFSF